MPQRGSAAKRYAEAVLELALERGTVDEWSEALERVTRSLSIDLLGLLAAASISFERRRSALEAVVRDEPSAVRALTLLLLERESIRLLPSVARASRDLLDERAGVAKALVTTALGLDDATETELIARLERASGRILRTRFKVDPDILAGAIVRIGDHQVDASLRTRLALLREQLAAASS